MERQTALSVIHVCGEQVRVGDAILADGYWWGVAYLSYYCGVVTVWAEDEDGDEREFYTSDIEDVHITFKV